MNKVIVMYCTIVDRVKIGSSNQSINLVHGLKEKSVKVGDIKIIQQLTMTEISSKEYCPFVTDK